MEKDDTCWSSIGLQLIEATGQERGGEREEEEEDGPLRSGFYLELIETGKEEEEEEEDILVH